MLPGVWCSCFWCVMTVYVVGCLGWVVFLSFWLASDARCAPHSDNCGILYIFILGSILIYEPFYKCTHGVVDTLLGISVGYAILNGLCVLRCGDCHSTLGRKQKQCQACYIRQRLLFLQINFLNDRGSWRNAIFVFLFFVFFVLGISRPWVFVHRVPLLRLRRSEKRYLRPSLESW